VAIYSVKARYIEEKMNEFYQKLTDGAIQNQKPDGQEIVNSMKRAKITEPDVIQWSEMCFCSPPLKHERETVYNEFLKDMETSTIDEYADATIQSIVSEFTLLGFEVNILDSESITISGNNAKTTYTIRNQDVSFEQAMFTTIKENIA